MNQNPGTETLPAEIYAKSPILPLALTEIMQDYEKPRGQFFRNPAQIISTVLPAQPPAAEDSFLGKFCKTDAGMFHIPAPAARLSGIRSPLRRLRGTVPAFSRRY